MINNLKVLEDMVGFTCRWNPLFISGRDLSFWNSPNNGSSNFSHKKRGLNKKRKAFIKRGYCLFLSSPTLSKIFFHCVCFAHLHLNLLCIFQDGLTLNQSILQICKLCKWVMFEKESCGRPAVQGKQLILLNYSVWHR